MSFYTKWLHAIRWDEGGVTSSKIHDITHPFMNLDSLSHQSWRTWFLTLLTSRATITRTRERKKEDILKLIPNVVPPVLSVL